MFVHAGSDGGTSAVATRKPQNFTITVTAALGAITRTSQHTHDIIRANFAGSPLFAGAIEGRGPRYCPSIEDKVKRFSERYPEPGANFFRLRKP